MLSYTQYIAVFHIVLIGMNATQHRRTTKITGKWEHLIETVGFLFFLPGNM
jgi:hypothetical protein